MSAFRFASIIGCCTELALMVIYSVGTCVGRVSLFLSLILYDGSAVLPCRIGISDFFSILEESSLCIACIREYYGFEISSSPCMLLMRLAF